MAQDMADSDGAIARFREWINVGAGRWIALLASLGLVTFAVLYFALRDETSDRRDDILGQGRKVLFYCRNCKETGTLEGVPFNAEFPLPCPKCGQKEAVVAFKCVRCGRIIEKKSEPVYRCPHCNFVYDNRITGGGEPLSGPPGGG
jgi:Zn finger protein HypA/HybF involved in hydrogenase expression